MEISINTLAKLHNLMNKGYEVHLLPFEEDDPYTSPKIEVTLNGTHIGYRDILDENLSVRDQNRKIKEDADLIRLMGWA